MSSRDTLEGVLAGLRGRKRKIVFENRPLRYCFGTKNYGEVPGTFNPADGDPFDVFAPGYSRRLPFGKPYVCKDVIGVFKLENNNDKIAVRIFAPGYDEEVAKRDIRNYCERYTRFTRKRGTWYGIDECLP